MPAAWKIGLIRIYYVIIVKNSAFEIKALLIVCILDKDKRHGDAFRPESFQSGVCSPEAFRAKLVNHPRSWSVLPVGRGLSALGPLGPPGLTLSFQVPALGGTEACPIFPCSQGFPVYLSRSCVHLHKMWTCSRSQDDRSYFCKFDMLGWRKCPVTLNSGPVHIVWSLQRRKLCVWECLCLYDLLSKYTVTRVCILTLV